MLKFKSSFSNLTTSNLWKFSICLKNMLLQLHRKIEFKVYKINVFVFYSEDIPA